MQRPAAVPSPQVPYTLQHMKLQNRPHASASTEKLDKTREEAWFAFWEAVLRNSAVRTSVALSMMTIANQNPARPSVSLREVLSSLHHYISTKGEVNAHTQLASEMIAYIDYDRQVTLTLDDLTHIFEAGRQSALTNVEQQGDHHA